MGDPGASGIADLHTRRGYAVPLARLLATEIAVGTVINIAFNLFFAWLVFYGRTPISRDAVLLDTIPASFLPAFLMTFAVTGLMRKRIGNGLTVLSGARLPVALPKKLPLRAAAIALLALALAAVPVAALLWLCWGGGLGLDDDGGVQGRLQRLSRFYNHTDRRDGIAGTRSV